MSSFLSSLLSSLRKHMWLILAFVLGVGGLIGNAWYGFQPIGASDAVVVGVKGNATAIFARREPVPEKYAINEIVVYAMPNVRDRFLVGRLVGKPGDEVEIRAGEIVRNGEPVARPEQAEKLPDWPRIRVPRGTIVVMADTRAGADSRRFGPIPLEVVRGAVVNAAE